LSWPIPVVSERDPALACLTGITPVPQEAQCFQYQTGAYC
jgi:hypothetical protein